MSSADHVVRQTLPLGDGAITCVAVGPSDTDLVCINVHENEWSAIDAGRRLVATDQVRFFHFDAGGERELSVPLAESTLRFDPNRIFSPSGIRSTLDTNDAPVTEETVDAVAAFARLLLELWDLRSARLVIALHNTGDDYCIHSYEPGGEEAPYAAELVVAPQAHRHDFFFVTDPDVYRGLVTRGFSAVLQAPPDSADDGSLSVWCAREQIPYVNVETRYGATDEQVRMVRAALEVFRALPRF